MMGGRHSKGSSTTAGVDAASHGRPVHDACAEVTNGKGSLVHLNGDAVHMNGKAAAAVAEGATGVDVHLSAVDMHAHDDAASPASADSTLMVKAVDSVLLPDAHVPQQLSDSVHAIHLDDPVPTIDVLPALDSNPDPEYDVVVIGAGIAGVSAVKHLLEAGVTRVLLLESSNRLGGRIYAAHWDDAPAEAAAEPGQQQQQQQPPGVDGAVAEPRLGLPRPELPQLPVGPAVGSTGVTGRPPLKLNFGAHWVAGYSEKNPLVPLLRQALPGHDANGADRAFITNFDDFPIYDEDGKRVAYDFKPIDAAFDRIAEISRSRQSRPKPRDMSMQCALDVTGMFFPASVVDRAVLWYYTDFEYATPPGDSSLLHTTPDPFLEAYGSDDQRLMATPNGAEDIMEPLLTPAVRACIRTNKRVARVEDQGGWLRLHCGDGTSYTARHTIMTVSFGVLTRRTIDFVPPLPSSKMEAICRYTMAYYEVVVLEFPHVFWERDIKHHCILYAHPRRGYYPWIHNLYPFYKRPLLEIHVCSDEAVRVSNQPIQQTRDEVMEVLRRIYGRDIPDPLKVQCTNWANDPNYYGAFTNWPIDMNEDDYEAIARPAYNHKLFFAGEAVHHRQSGYMHGAFLTGVGASKQVVRALKGDREWDWRRWQQQMGE